MSYPPDSWKLDTPPRYDDLPTWCHECDRPLTGPGEKCQTCDPPDDDDEDADAVPEPTPLVVGDDPDAADLPEPDIGGEGRL